MMDYDQKIQAALLRQKDAMGRARYQSPEAKMVGGRYIAPNALEYLAAGLRSAGAGRESQMANQEMEQLQTQKQEAMQADQAAMINALRGTPEKTISAPSPFDTEGAGQFTMPAQAGSLDKFYDVAANSQIPQYQQMGMQGAITNAQEQAKIAKVQDENKRIMSILQSSESPQAAIASGVPADTVKAYYESPNYGRAKVKYQDVGGQLVPVDEFGGTPANVKPLPKTGNPFSDLLLRGEDGAITPNLPLVGAKSTIAKAGKPQINVDARNFNTQESKQSEAYGKTLGEIRGAITQAGFDAPRKLQQLSRMEQLLGNVDAGGKAAPLAADIASYAKSIGITIDPKLGAKEAAQALAVEMALGMKKPGSGTSTDKDFDAFMDTVPDLSKTPEGRKQITKTIRAAVQRDLEASKFARNYAKKNNGVIDDEFFDAMANFYAENPVVTPNIPATNSRGNKLFQDADAILNRGKK